MKTCRDHIARTPRLNIIPFLIVFLNVNNLKDFFFQKSTFFFKIFYKNDIFHQKSSKMAIFGQDGNFILFFAQKSYFLLNFVENLHQKIAPF
jgi:hypothetical protein